MEIRSRLQALEQEILECQRAIDRGEAAIASGGSGLRLDVPLFTSYPKRLEELKIARKQLLLEMRNTGS